MTSTAKLVAVRGNTAFITDIKHASASPSSKFSDDDIVLVGNTTGITQAVSAQQIDSGLPINADQSYEHRSGYARPIATSARNNANWIRLAPEAPSYTNAIAANSMAWGSDIEDTQHQGVWMTSIQIVKGKNAGKRGLITYYDGSTREAHVEWSSDPDLDTGVDANGVLASESQDYYTLGSSRYPDATIFTSFTGEYFGTFHLPSNDNTKFTTGTKNLLLNDRSDNNPFLIKTWATAAYQASGTVNHLIDEVVATRDTVVGSVGSGMELEYRSHAGQSFIEATRISDGVKGVLHAVVDIDIISQGGRNVRLAEGASDAGSSSNPYLPYFETVSSFTWFSYSTHTNQPSGTAGVRGGGAPYLMGKVVGATSIDGIEWNYTPTPVTDGVGRACSDWNVMYATQAGEDSFRAAKTGQIHSHHPGASCGAWRFGSQRSSFPSLIPLGGNMGGCKAFATVEDGRIVDATITDHGCAVVNREDGEEAVGPVWRAVYYKNGWQLGDSSAGAQNFPHMFVGRSVVSSDPDVIRAKVPYINQMMSDIEAGVLARNAAASVTGQDPLAQSFTIPADGPGASPHGVFLNGVDLWFVEKPTAGDNTEVGVTVEIRRMVNGYPDSVGPIPCVAGSSQAMAEVPAANINVRNNQAETVAGGTGLLDVNDENSYTTFTFPAPVYLLPGVDYCFVVRCAGSKDYYLWSADYRGHVLGTRTPMETAKPLGQFDGSLFLSQNAKTWEPDQYKDLMFRLRRCNFTGSTGTAVFTAGANVRRRLRDEEGNEMGSIGEVQLESDYDFDFFRVNEEHIIPLDDEVLIVVLFNISIWRQTQAIRMMAITTLRQLLLFIQISNCA